jgi:hypothetical protein
MAKQYRLARLLEALWIKFSWTMLRRPDQEEVVGAWPICGLYEALKNSYTGKLTERKNSDNVFDVIVSLFLKK